MPAADNAERRSRRRWLRRLAVLGTIGGVAAYRKRALDAADRAFPQATTKPS